MIRLAAATAAALLAAACQTSKPQPTASVERPVAPSATPSTVASTDSRLPEARRLMSEADKMAWDCSIDSAAKLFWAAPKDAARDIANAAFDECTSTWVLVGKAFSLVTVYSGRSMDKPETTMEALRTRFSDFAVPILISQRQKFRETDRSAPPAPLPRVAPPPPATIGA